MDRQQPIVTSGDESDGDGNSSEGGRFCDSEEDSVIDETSPSGKQGVSSEGNRNNSEETDVDELYDEHADEEDAAYVNQNLRGSSFYGTGEATGLQKSNLAPSGDAGSVKPRASPSLEQQQRRQPHLRMRPAPNSDAVLSCPCCFSTVCMDCQQHERYQNQYRAMFVMNIIVRWDLKIWFDPEQKRLVPVVKKPTAIQLQSSQMHGDASTHTTSDTVPLESDKRASRRTTESARSPSDDEVYYTVTCANCSTQVASLDMRDEVYHFYGCLASS